MSSAHCPVVWCGEPLLLTGERALVWPAERTVLVADVHLGKEAVFRRHGLAIPDGPTERSLSRLSRLVREHGCERIVVLGDFMHAAPHAGDTWPDTVSRWLDAHSQVAVEIVAGNHDRKTGRTRLDSRLRWHLGSLAAGPFELRHEPRAAVGPEFAISGHLHPVFRARIGAERLRTPVFWQRPHSAILPAFGQFTGGHPIEPEPGERVWLVHEGAVVELPMEAAWSRIMR